MVLVIRQRQLAALQFDTDLRWYQRRLAELYPDFAVATVAQQHDWIVQSLQRARDAGLTRLEYFQFLCFEQTFAPASLADPSLDWAHLLLTEADKSPGDRMKQLRQETIRRLLMIEAQAEQAALHVDDEAFDETLDDSVDLENGADDSEAQDDEPEGADRAPASTHPEGAAS